MIVRIDHMNLNQIANSGQCFRWRQIKDSLYKIPAFGKELMISQDGDLFYLSCDESEWNDIWKRYFDVDTDTDYNEAEKIIMESNDDFLKDAYQFGSGIRILRQDLWEVIISFIISQNNNIPRIKKSIEKLCDEVGGRFPTNQELLQMDLSDKGLGYRDKYIKEISKCCVFDFNILDGMGFTYEQNKKILMNFKGIGNKVSDCICLFGLHHLDAFPVDTHVKTIIDREYDGKMPKWADCKYAGLFQQYIFYYELNHKNQLKETTETVGYADENGLMTAT